MHDDSLILAVDGGGSSTKALLYHADGEVIKEKALGPLSLKSSDEETVLRSLRELASFVESSGPSIAVAVLGLSGLDSPQDFSGIIKLLKETGFCVADANPTHHPLGQEISSAFGFRILLCSDALLPLYANDRTSGAVLIAGTGSVALRVSKDGTVRRFGGWGYRVSDEGSGYWVGCEFMREALRAADAVLSGNLSNQASVSALQLIEAAFKATVQHSDMSAIHTSRMSVAPTMPNVPTAYERARLLAEWATLHDDPKAYAALAQIVLESTLVVCEDIRHRAAHHLAWLASCAFDQAAPVIILSGGLFKNENFAKLVTASILESFSTEDVSTEGVRVIVSESDPATGAFAIARSRIFEL